MDNKCSYFPLRWESTGDQWWYASPIDWAAADGHYDIVRQLLHLDPNLLIKLTSLRRIRRLEALWDDDARFAGASRHRAAVARSLLLECECKAGAGAENTLLRAGYGGWLLYSAASAGDMGFVRELLERDALLVFGEGEYGVTDMLYAAARGGDAGVFRLLLDHAMSPRCSTNCRDGEGAGAGGGRASVFRLEMMSRALHAAARGGSVEILRELVDGRSGVSEHLDARGSTVLHAAAGRGQLEVAKYLMAAFDIINSTDNQGNTALHVAAYRGHLPVVEALVAASPSTLSSVNHAGDTFLHTAVAGFRTPGFRRLDRQMELMRYLVRERTTDIQKIINLKNDAGLTALHMAVVGCVHPDLVALLMTTPSIDLNAEDSNGMTPLALLKQQLRSTTSERLIKQIVSAGGVLNSSVLRTRSAIVSQIRMQGGIASSPGTTFKISDAEIFLFSGIGAAESRRPSSCSSSGKCDAACEDANGVNGENHGSSEKRLSSASRAKDRLKMMLRWPRHKDKMSRMLRKSEDGNPLDSIKKLREQVVETPAPLRQTFTKTTALNNKRTLAVKSSTPSSATKKKLNTKLIHGIMESMPHLASSTRSPATTLPRSSMSSTPPSGKLKGICLEDDEDYSTTAPISFKLKDVVLDNTLDEPSCSTWSTYEDGSVTENPARKHGCGNGRLINICFGAQGLTVEDSANGQQTSKMFKQQCLRVS